MCNHQPWSIKPTIHLIYKVLMQKITFQCKKCPNDERYHLEDFKSHLSKMHNKKIEDFKLKLYKYWIRDQGTTILLNFTQNL
jgi:hypothetical protein